MGVPDDGEIRPKLPRARVNVRLTGRGGIGLQKMYLPVFAFVVYMTGWQYLIHE